MKIEKIVCDICGTEATGKFEIPVKTQIDVPSGRTEDWTEPVDLCNKHLMMYFMSIIEALGPKIGYEIHNAIRGKKVLRSIDLQSILSDYKWKRR